MNAPRIHPQELFERMSRGERVLFVDARNDVTWYSSDRKLPGAIRVPPDDVDNVYSEIPRGAVTVAYCACPAERSSARAASRLAELGFPEVYALEGGFDAWMGFGFPLEMKSGTMLGEHAL